MRRPRVAILPLLVCGVAASSLAESPSATTQPASRPGRLYSIRLERPAHPGKAGGIDMAYASVETERTWYDDAKEPVITRQVSRGTRLLAALEFLAVGPDGHTILERFDVRSLTTLDDNGNTIDLLPNGTQLFARRDGKRTIFTVNNRNRPAPKAVSEALFRVISLRPKAVIDDDLIFGTTEPRAVGQVWEVNREAAAAAFKFNDTLVDPADVTGTGRITGTEVYNGADCLHVIAEMQVKRLVELLPPAGGNATTHPTTRPAHPGEECSMTSSLEWLALASESGGTDRMLSTSEKTYISRGTENHRAFRRERTIREEWDTRDLAQ